MLIVAAHILAGLAGALIACLVMCKLCFGYAPWHARMDQTAFDRLYIWDASRTKFVRRPNG